MTAQVVRRFVNCILLISSCSFLVIVSLDTPERDNRRGNNLYIKISFEMSVLRGVVHAKLLHPAVTRAPGTGKCVGVEKG